MAVLQATAQFIAVTVERCHHFGGKPRRLLQHTVDGFAVQADVQLLTMPAQVAQFMQDKTHITQRRPIVHTRPSCTAAKPLPAATRRAISGADCQWAP
ncbi:hypothetical protein D3C72_2257030 [compost metagenome]